MPGFAFPTEVIGPVDGSRVVRFVLNTASPDRDGTVFPPKNCDSTAFLRNPVFTWGHAELQGSTRRVDPDEVIGRVLAVEVQSSPDRLVIPVEFRSAEANDLAERCFQAVKDGFLRATSITAKPLRTHKEGALTVADAWELWAASLCIVGSNPEALALRSLLSREANMDKATMLQALGLADGATYEECLQALVNKLADDADKQALAAAVMSMKTEATGQAAGGDGACGPEVEKAAMRMVIEAQKRELEARSVAPAETPEQWAAAKVKAGQWYKSSQEALAKMRKEHPEAAARAVEMFKPGELGAHSERLGALAPGLGGAQARGVNFGKDPERVPAEGADVAAVKADAKAIRDKAARRSRSETGGAARIEE